MQVVASSNGSAVHAACYPAGDNTANRRLSWSAAWAPGPLFAFERDRQARKPRFFWLRCLFPLLLLLLLAWRLADASPTAPSFFELFTTGQAALSHRDLREVGQRFIAELFIYQGIALLLLTPPLVAGAIVEERRLKTLELLFTTQVTDREIVVGKALGRFLPLAALTVSGLPVVALLQLWGGVPFSWLLVGYGLTLVGIFGVACLSLAVSALARSFGEALAITYALSVPAVSFSGMCAAFLLFATASPLAFFLISIPSLIIVGCMCSAAMTRAAAEMRKDPKAEMRDLSRPAPAAPPPELKPAVPEPQVVAAFPTRQLLPLPPVSEQPVAWKEAHLGRTLEERSLFLVLVAGPALVAGVGLSLALLGNYAVALVQSYLDRTRRPYLLSDISYLWENYDSLRVIYLVVLLLVFMILLAQVVFRIARSLPHEREQDTLLNLLLLPWPRGELLAELRWGALRRCWALLQTLAGLLALGVVVGFFFPPTASLLALAAAVFLYAFANLALLIAVVCRRQLGASFAAGALMLFLVVGALSSSFQLENQRGGSWSRPTQEATAAELAVGVAFVPLRTLWFMGQSWTDFSANLTQAGGAPRQHLAAALASVGLWFCVGLAAGALARYALAPRRGKRPATLESRL